MFSKSKTKLDVLNDQLIRLHAELSAFSWDTDKIPTKDDPYFEVLKQIQTITNYVMNTPEDKNVRRY